MEVSMRKWTGMMVVACIFLFSGSRVAAQSKPKIARANIPFQFWIGDRQLPAGEYNIEHVESATSVLFRSADGKTISEAYMMPVDDSSVTPASAKLVFRIQNGRHYLYQFWGIYGKRILTGEFGLPAPSTDSRLDLRVTYN